MTNDSISTNLDIIARWLEGNGYAIDVDYATACIIVWLENWPLVVEIKRHHTTQRSSDSTPDET
jgi:hypothetical protein